MLAVQVSYWTLQETKRHNEAQEQYWSNDLAEKRRHNQVTEEQGWQQIAIAQEQVAIGWENVEVGWANAAASQANAEARMASAQASMVSAQAALMNANTNAKAAVFNQAHQLVQTQLAFSQYQFQKHQFTVNTKLRVMEDIVNVAKTTAGAAAQAFGTR